MFLATFDFEYTYIKKWCYASGVYNKFKSCEISSQMFFNVMFSFSKTKDELVMMKYCKIKLFSGSIWHGVSNEPGAYLEPSQTCERAFLQKQLTA